MQSILTLHICMNVPNYIWLGLSIEIMPISNCMTLSVVSATSNQTIRDVCKIMCEYKIGSVIILKDTAPAQCNNPIGITTERDVVTNLGSKTQSPLLQTPVFEIMSHPLVTIQSNSSLKDGIETMQLKNIRRLPVINKEHNSDTCYCYFCHYI